MHALRAAAAMRPLRRGRRRLSHGDDEATVLDGNDARAPWTLDPEVVFLNHGSFGACPAPVLARQSELRAQLEREPVAFMLRELEGLLDEARAALGAFLGARPADLVFVPNATTGVNTVLRSLALRPGDELLLTDHGYNACRAAAEAVARAAGARVRVVALPFPVASADALVEPLLLALGPRTRLLLVDHVTSPTGLVLPVERIVPEVSARGVDVLVDGAHAPGMLPLDLTRLGAAYYTGNAHKWLCAPKGAAFLHVREDRHAPLAPLVTSHGFDSPRTDRSRLHLQFDWPGTHDPTAVLCLPVALATLAGLHEDGWPGLMAANRALALAARALLCDALGIEPPCPDGLVGALAALPLPAGPPRNGAVDALGIDPLQERLFREHRIEVPVMRWPAPPARLLRVSAQRYNRLDEYRLLADALAGLLRDEDTSRGAHA